MIRSLSLITAAALFATPAMAQDHAHEEHGQQPPAQQQSDPHAVETAPAPASQPEPHAEHQMGGQPAVQDHASMMASMTGIYGAYAMGRDASGTAWQPDVSEHGGLHFHQGEWMLMGHVMLNGVYDWQDGPRGDEKAFLAGMIMGAARRDIGDNGTLNFRVMLSPDPLMGARGYPLLFAAGESADGANSLIDRQHPHDLFMELSAAYTHRVSAEDSLFIYGGLPGEPAFGPPAFMHRLSAMDSPEAPISHHWLDSTHITFGVVTAGWVHGDWKIEGSAFRGREPDEDRYDIESGDLDSTAVRLSWNPSENWSLQVSWADIESPEALEPDEDEERWSASAIYTRAIGDGWISGTVSYGSKERSDGVSLDAWLVEAAWRPNERWTLFSRFEAIETDELEPPAHGPIREAQRLSLGAVRDWRVSDHAVFGVGAVLQQHFADDALEASYDGDPQGAMAFVRLKIG